jgi:2-polyprenyl-3-methyl-5-hydroxy-6-metoxy-1,4-benzoquinol methylase
MSGSTDYFSHGRHEMLAFIPLNARRILEIGCANGAFSAQIKQHQATEIWGLELDANAATRASQNIDRVFQGSLDAHLDNLPDGYFDCIVCNDVLEYLSDPVEILRLLPRVMAPGAVLVGSIPNVRYFPVLFDLIWHADWNYADYGVLDRTHQRFFTGKSLTRTLRNCGYQPQQIVGINTTRSLRAKLVTALTLGKLSDCRYQQYAFVARPA